MDWDITPMIDIVFLLLIFFMVCSTLDRKNPVVLPMAEHGTVLSQRNATVITVDGEKGRVVVYLGDGTANEPLTGNWTVQEQAVVKAVENGLHDGKTAVLLKAAGRLPHGEVAKIETAIVSVPGVTIHLAVTEGNEN